MEGNAIVQTTSGKVRGVCGYTFLGIPYGTAERFCPAKQVYWEGIKNCSHYGPVSVQPNFLGKKPENVIFSAIGSEDCLNLNIWTPDVKPEAKMPVVIFVHGGGFQTGSNSHPMRAGDHFAQGDRMVFVSVNYRLGVLGGLYLGGMLGDKFRQSGSNSALDVLLAVRWVKENIASFGGDPEHITLMGVSAGAKIIGALMTLPEAQNLFGQVILESGAMQAFRTKKTASAIAERYWEILRPESPEQLLDCPVETLVHAQAELCDCEGSTCFFGPVFDGEIFREDWSERWEAGFGWKGAALLGSNRNEMYREVRRPDFLREAERVMRTCFGDNDKMILAAVETLKHQAKARGEEPDETSIWQKVYSDYLYRSPQDLLARRLIRLGDQVWQYSFEFWPASHAMGLAYAMRMERNPMSVVPEEKMEQAAVLAERMNRAVRAFILTGRPEMGISSQWEASYSERTVKMFFTENPKARIVSRDSLPGAPEYTLKLT